MTTASVLKDTCTQCGDGTKPDHKLCTACEKRQDEPPSRYALKRRLGSIRNYRIIR